MSKGLEALEDGYNETFKTWLWIAEGNAKNVNFPLKKEDITECKRDFTKKYHIIEKELKALEIIKNKCIDMYELKDLIEFNIPSKDAIEIYNKKKDIAYQITIEEFDLLKEVLL